MVARNRHSSTQEPAVELVDADIIVRSTDDRTPKQIAEEIASTLSNDFAEIVKRHLKPHEKQRA